MILPASQAIPVAPEAEIYLCYSNYPEKDIIITDLKQYFIIKTSEYLRCKLTLNDAHLNAISTRKSLQRTEKKVIIWTSGSSHQN